MVGYWAEARILGGVVLFDRRQQDTTDAIYFHSDRYNITYRIYQLLPEQRKALLDFLISTGPSPTNPLPTLGDERNRIRVDPEEPIQATGIYRDLWERKDLLLYGPDERRRDVWDVREYPTLDDFSAAQRRARERMNRSYEMGEEES
jgi:hypothetical protein